MTASQSIVCSDQARAMLPTAAAGFVVGVTAYHTLTLSLLASNTIGTTVGVAVGTAQRAFCDGKVGIGGGLVDGAKGFAGGYGAYLLMENLILPGLVAAVYRDPRPDAGMKVGIKETFAELSHVIRNRIAGGWSSYNPLDSVEIADVKRNFEILRGSAERSSTLTGNETIAIERALDAILKAMSNDRVSLGEAVRKVSRNSPNLEPAIKSIVEKLTEQR